MTLLLQHVIQSRDGTPLDSNFPNAWFRIEGPTLQNIQEMSLNYVRIDGIIQNINANSGFLWVYYPDIVNPDDKWQEITFKYGYYNDPSSLVSALNESLITQKPSGTTLQYSIIYDTNAKRIRFNEPSTTIGGREIQFIDSDLNTILGFTDIDLKWDEDSTNGEDVWAISTPDLFANFKEIYLLSNAGKNTHFEILWPSQANPSNVLAILPLVWRTESDQPAEFCFTALELPYMCPTHFETAKSIRTIEFQLIFRDARGFHLLPQIGQSGNTFIVNYSLLNN